MTKESLPEKPKMFQISEKDFYNLFKIMISINNLRVKILNTFFPDFISPDELDEKLTRLSISLDKIIKNIHKQGGHKQ